jgi:F-type H+-transporting ATPase subunit epsilon
MADTFQLEIVTPERLVVRDVAEEVQIPGKNGYLGILPGHAPLITELAVGEITYRLGNTAHHLACAWGFAEVLPARVTILAETAERAEDINAERARQARDRAQGELEKVETPEQTEHALNNLRRAEVRLEVAAKAGKLTEAH